MDIDAVFEAVDAEILELVDARSACLRAILVSRVAIVGGGAMLVLSLPFAALRAPTIAFAALAAVIGGVVWAGASRTSREEIDARLADAEARKSGLFDTVAGRSGWRDITPTMH